MCINYFYFKNFFPSLSNSVVKLEQFYYSLVLLEYLGSCFQITWVKPIANSEMEKEQIKLFFLATLVKVFNILIRE